MLDLKGIDLEGLAYALEDHSPDMQWWFDPRSGESIPQLESSLDEDEDLDKDELVPIEPMPSGESYADMEDFIALVRDPRARELLERAIAGRGAFRRFKDTLVDFPELREAWFSFHNARLERRAIEWLRNEGLIAEEDIEEAIRERPDPDLPELSGPFDPYEIAHAVADDLRELYGDRLRKVILFGSWARGDAHPESDIDLLVVLDRVDSSWEELRRMDDILSRHSFDNDTVVTASPVSDPEFETRKTPFLITARADGIEIE